MSIGWAGSPKTTGSNAMFKHRVLVDFEFVSKSGERPDVVCCAYRSTRSRPASYGATSWETSLPTRSAMTPWSSRSLKPNGACHLALAWKLPKHVVDLNCELRLASNGLKLPAGQSLLGFCRWLGIEAGDAAVKDAIRSRIIKGWPFTPEEQEMILKYAGSDVDILALLFERLEPRLDYDRALYRGNWSWVSAIMENNGVPINGPLFRQIANPVAWGMMRDALVPELDRTGAYAKHNDGTYHFNFDRFGDYLKGEGIAWPLTEDGRLSTDSKTFEDMSKGHAQLEDLRQLRHIRDKMRSVDLAVGADDRNRTVLWPYKAKSGRTQPAASKWAFSPAVWMRNLIQPGEGKAIAYPDYSLDGIPDRRGEVARPADVEVLRKRSLSEFRQARRRRALMGDQADARRAAGSLQDRPAGDSVWRCRLHAGRQARRLSGRGSSDDRPASRAVFDLLGVGRRLARLGARPRHHVDAFRLAMRGRRRRTEDPHDHQLAGSKRRRRHFAAGMRLGDQARTETMRAGP